MVLIWLERNMEIICNICYNFRKPIACNGKSLLWTCVYHFPYGIMVQGHVQKIFSHCYPVRTAECERFNTGNV